MTNHPGYGEQPRDPAGQPSYGPGYWQPSYGPGYGQPGYGQPPSHGKALAAMITGIVSLVLACGYGVGLLGSPIALWLGAKALKEIDASHGQLGGRGMAQAGFILGIIGTVLLVLMVVALAALIVFATNRRGGTGNFL